MTTAPVYSTSHTGLCVTDLERSLRFYCDGLGFVPMFRYDLGDEYGAALEVDGEVKVTSQMIRKEGLMIELLSYPSPGVIGRPSDRRNHLGLTHLSFVVNDLDAALKRLVDHGGTIITTTRTTTRHGSTSLDLVFVTDPDGTRVELMQMTHAT